MKIALRPIEKADMPQATAIWNAVVEEGDSFPGDDVLSEAEAWDMFCAQTETVCAVMGDEIVGVYILHPNNIGRCAHIANASYAVKAQVRGQGIGRLLVEDCMSRAKKDGFRGLQFNAVVASNTAAIALYLKLGFKVLGTVTGGYRDKDGQYRDTLIFLKMFVDN
jgi:L-amino acid N-acyltransferase YncA